MTRKLDPQANADHAPTTRLSLQRETVKLLRMRSNVQTGSGRPTVWRGCGGSGGGIVTTDNTRDCVTHLCG
jgi:hypothetical protein